jgi:hypothetical protein
MANTNAATAETFTSLDELRNAGVEEDFVVESNDYVENMPPLPGIYTSPSRSLTNIKKKDGNTTFELSFTSGLHDTETGKIHGEGKYPFRNWPSTKPFVPKNGTGYTSGVAQYLSRVGFDTKGMTQEQMFDAIEESLNLPVAVRVDWEDQGEKQDDGTYSSLKLKSKDFVTGTTPEGADIYSPTIQVNGKTVKAKARISGFRKVSE